MSIGSPNGPNTSPGKAARTAQAVRQQFRVLEQQVHTVLCLSGICRTVGVLFAGLIVCGWLDWMLQLDDPGLRILCGISCLGLVGWTFWRWLWIPLSASRSHTQIAALLERRRPYLAGQLVSAAEFLEHRLDPGRGSPLLQQAAVDQAMQRFDSLDIEGVIDRRDVRTQALLATVTCMTALALVICYPRESATAITRLLLPFRHTPWPRAVELQFVEHDLSTWPADRIQTRRVARGDTLELYVRNQAGTLPNDVQLEYRVGDEGRLIRESMRKTILRDDQGHPLDVAGLNLPVLRGPIQIRAVGGDHADMEFYTIDVVVPPEITSLQLRLQPPAYAHLPEEHLPEGVGDLLALPGTRVRLTCETSQPLLEAALVFQGGERIPLALTDEGTQLTTEFVLDDPKVTGYRLDLTNLDGFGAGERSPQYTIRLTPDQPPQVNLEEPAADLTATADAELPIRALMKDDLGLAQSALSYLVINPSTFVDGTEQSSESQRRVLRDYPGDAKEDQLTDTWSLGELQLAPGAQVQFHIAATDRFDLGPPHVGRSATRTITIVGGEEKREDLTDRLGELLSDLSDGITVQRRITEQTRQLEEKLQTADALQPQDADALRKLDLEQQRVAQQLLDPGLSVRAQARQLQAEFEANHLSQGETNDRLNRLADTLTELGTDGLPELQQRLTQAQKQAGDSTPQAAARMADELKELAQQQAKTLTTLEELESGLSEWRDRRHLAQQLSGLIETQRTLNRQTRDAAESQLVGETESAATPAGRTEVQKLSQRQRSQADAVDQFQQRIEELVKAEAEREPEAAAQLEDLQQALEQSGLSSQLREAAASLSDNRPGQAAQQQSQGLEQLESLESLLQNRPPDTQEALVKQMKSVESQLETLQQRQDELSREFHSAASEPENEERLEQLEKRQEEIRDDLEQIERELERLQLQKPREVAHRAGERMERLTKSDSAEDRADQMQETLDDLEQARRELAEERERAAEELAFEELLRLKDELIGLAERQAGVRAEVLRLDELRTQRGSLTRGQLRTLLQTGATQRDLSLTFTELSARIASVEVLSLTLRRVADRMGAVADRLDAKEVDAAVNQRLEAIEAQLTRLLAVLAEAESTANNDQPQPPAEQAEQAKQPTGPPGDVVTLIAQLELLRDLQADCAMRTAEFQQRRGERVELTPEETAELASIQAEQSDLTDLARNLMTKFQQRPDSRPSGETDPSL